MNQLVKYQVQASLDGQSLIFCQFCRKYFYPAFFSRHLQFCSGYIRHAYQNQRTEQRALTWQGYNQQRQYSQRPPQRKPRNRISFQTHPGLFKSMIQNKRVIIVGPSVTIQDCHLGKFIDSFDVVIRLNKSLPVPPHMHEHIGSRTDILYNSLNTTDYPGENNINPIFLKHQKIRYLRSPYPPITPFKYDIRSFQRKNRNIVPFGHIDQDYYKKLRYSLQTRPYTGTCAVADILHCNAKELYVMGIDFYTYGYAKYYRKVSSKKLDRLRNNNIHKRTPQIDLMRRFYLLDKRLIVDNILDKILLEEYDSLFYNLQSQVDFSKTCISSGENYIGPESILSLFRSKARRAAKKDMGINRLSICIIGDLDSENINADAYKRFDLVIDLFPDRFPRLKKPPEIAVFQTMEEWRPDMLSKDQVSLITQSFRKELCFHDNDDRFVNTNPEKTLFLNPLFTKYLRSILTQSVIQEGTVSTEIFLALFFSSFYCEFADVYVSKMDPYVSWSQQPAHQRQHAISQRMLYRYLVRREVIKEFNPEPTPREQEASHPKS